MKNVESLHFFVIVGSVSNRKVLLMLISLYFSQMGQLFAQMATMVSEQSEVIMRIEDDVEAGLEQTLQAQGHLQNVFEITKGNRSMILKIFALLVFFIVLFLVWT